MTTPVSLLFSLFACDQTTPAAREQTISAKGEGSVKMQSGFEGCEISDGCAEVRTTMSARADAALDAMDQLKQLCSGMGGALKGSPERTSLNDSSYSMNDWMYAKSEMTFTQTCVVSEAATPAENTDYYSPPVESSGPALDFWPFKRDCYNDWAVQCGPGVDAGI